MKQSRALSLVVPAIVVVAAAAFLRASQESPQPSAATTQASARDRGKPEESFVSATGPAPQAFVVGSRDGHAARITAVVFNPNTHTGAGWARQMEPWVSNDSPTTGYATAGTLELTPDDVEQTMTAAPVTARFVKIVAAMAIAAVYFWYVSIVTRRNKVREAWSLVDVHLTQRHDLIPNLVALAAKYMEHERGLLTDVTRLRDQARTAPAGTPADAAKRFALEGELGQRVSQLLVSLEAYPELEADRPVIEAQRTWTETEAQITASRRFYNAAVNQLNNAIQVFPGSVIAGLAGVSPMPLYEAPAEARVAPTVDGILGRRS